MIELVNLILKKCVFLSLKIKILVKFGVILSDIINPVHSREGT